MRSTDQYAREKGAKPLVEQRRMSGAGGAMEHTSIVGSATRGHRSAGGISFARLLRVVIVCLAGILAALFFVQYLWGEQFYANFATYAVVLLACVVLLRLARPTRSRAETILRLGAVYTLLFVFLQRIIFLIPFSETFGRADAAGHPLRLYTLAEFHRSILAYLGFIAAFFIGVRGIVRQSLRGVRAARRARDYMPFAVRRLLFVGAIVVFVLVQALTFVFGWRMTGDYWRSGWLIRLLPASLFTWALVLLYYTHRPALSKFERVFIVGLLAIQSVMSLAQGSRSGLQALIDVLIFGALLTHGSFRMPARFIMIGGAFALLIGPMFWSAGSHIRSTGNFGFASIPLTETVRAVSSRFGNGTENFIIAMSGWLDANAVQQYLTPRNVIGAGINGAVPGELVRVPIEAMGDLWETLAWGIPLETRRHGEWWHVGAQLTVMFGYGVALVAVTAFGAVSAWILSRLLARRTLSGLLVAALVFSIVREFFNGQNLDGMITSIITLPLYAFVLFVIVRLLLTVAIPADCEVGRSQCDGSVRARSPS